jgi:hypothetical protein
MPPRFSPLLPLRSLNTHTPTTFSPTFLRRYANMASASSVEYDPKDVSLCVRTGEGRRPSPSAPLTDRFVADDLLPSRKVGTQGLQAISWRMAHDRPAPEGRYRQGCEYGGKTRRTGGEQAGSSTERGPELEAMLTVLSTLRLCLFLRWSKVSHLPMSSVRLKAREGRGM